MSFLDNSGDIILDAVITDAGRKRMAEGKFSITKYAFGDEEINYALFNNAHPSGSAFYDLQIMQTPIFEAFTNNTSTMSSKLMTLYDNNYLYLPVLRLNENWGMPMPEKCKGAANECKHWSSRIIKNAYAFDDDGNVDITVDDSDTASGIQENSQEHSGMFVVTCDSSTEDLWRKYPKDIADSPSFVQDSIHYSEGVILGASTNERMDMSFICVDQGVEGSTSGLSVLTPFPSELRETAYMIQIDHRLGRIAVAPSAPTKITSQQNGVTPKTHRRYGEEQDAGAEGNAQGNGAALMSRDVLPYSFVDDDHMATYYITTARPDVMQPDILSSFNDGGSLPDSTHFASKTLAGPGDIAGAATRRWLARQVFQDGPVGSRLQFTIRAQDTVKLSSDLFDTSKTKKLYRDSVRTEHKVGPGDAAGNAAAEQVWVVGSSASSPVNHIDVYYIDSTITVTGVTTGYSLNIPVRFVKRKLS